MIGVPVVLFRSRTSLRIRAHSRSVGARSKRRQGLSAPPARQLHAGWRCGSRSLGDEAAPPSGGDSGLGPWFSNLSASWNLGETPTPRMRARHAHSTGLACILCPCSCRGIGTDRIGMLHPRILTRQWRNKRQTRVGFPRMIPTEGAHGLHSPRGNSAFFTCEFINHHQERPAEPGADRSHPVRSLTQVATSQREQNRPDGSHADNH